MIKRNTHKKRNFHTRAGCEYTFIPVGVMPLRKTPRYRYDNEIPDLTKYFKIISAKFGAHSKIRKAIHMDTGIIEIPTRIMPDYNVFKKEYSDRAKAAKLLKCVPKHKKIQHGGSHIHLEMPKFDKCSKSKIELFIKNFYIYTINNPAVLWAFSDPNDNLNKSILCEYKTFDKRMIQYYLKLNILEYNDDYFKYMLTFAKKCKKNKDWKKISVDMKMTDMIRNINNSSQIFISKNSVIRYRPDFNTIELRCFDMSENYIEAKRQMEFAQALWKYIYNITDKNQTLEIKINSHSELNKIPLKDSLVQVEDNLKMLGLNPFNYINQFKNLKTRYSFGSLYLL